MLNLNFVTPKSTSLRETESYEPSCVKISSVVFPVEHGKKKGKKREGQAESHASVIFHLFVRKPPVNKCLPNFACREIICAKIEVKKLRSLGFTGGGKILGSPIEMAGHLYNSAALPRGL